VQAQKERLQQLLAGLQASEDAQTSAGSKLAASPHAAPESKESLIASPFTPPVASSSQTSGQPSTSSVPATEVAKSTDRPPTQESPRTQLISSFISSIAAVSAPTTCAGSTSKSSSVQAQPGSHDGASRGPQPKRRGRRWRLREMRVSHVLKCLQRLQMDQYAPAFERYDIDGWMCDFLDEEILEMQLGVAEPEHRRRFLSWVESMQVVGAER